MAKKKITKLPSETQETKVDVVFGVITQNPTIDRLPIEYSNEGLNNMARKVNEIIDYLNEKK